MSKHTPGPWKVCGLETVTDARANQIAIADNLSDTRDPEAFAESRANAQLIAAAPELLDACGRARNYLLCSGDGKSHCVEVLQAAIAKATNPETSPNRRPKR